MDGDVLMETSGDLGMVDLRNCLIQLKQKVEALVSMKRGKTDNEAIDQYYKTQLLPLILKVRRLNRLEKNELDSMTRKAKVLNQDLRTLSETCACLEFEAACLSKDVSNVPIPKRPTKKLNELSNNLNGDIFDIDLVAGHDHQTRMRLLDEEQDKRRQLQQKLINLTDELNTIERSSTINARQLDQVKPYIRQLLEKIEQTTNLRTC